MKRKMKILKVFFQNFFYIMKVKWFTPTGCKHICLFCPYAYECFSELEYEMRCEKCKK